MRFQTKGNWEINFSYLHPLKLGCLRSLNSGGRHVKDFPPFPRRALRADLLVLPDPLRSKVPAAYRALGEPCFWGKLWLLLGRRLPRRLASGKLFLGGLRQTLFRGGLRHASLRTKCVLPAVAVASSFAFYPLAKGVVSGRCSWKFWILLCQWVRGHLRWRLVPLNILGGEGCGQATTPKFWFNFNTFLWIVAASLCALLICLLLLSWTPSFSWLCSPPPAPLPCCPPAPLPRLTSALPLVPSDLAPSLRPLLLFGSLAWQLSDDIFLDRRSIFGSF